MLFVVVQQLPSSVKSLRYKVLTLHLQSKKKRYQELKELWAGEPVKCAINEIFSKSIRIPFVMVREVNTASSREYGVHMVLDLFSITTKGLK
jgi:hypothetical protein